MPVVGPGRRVCRLLPGMLVAMAVVAGCGDAGSRAADPAPAPTSATTRATPTTPATTPGPP